MNEREQNTTFVFSPFSGVVTSLADVPDPAFSEGMLGEGVAIEPLDNCVIAPFDGTVLAVAKTGHSVTIKSASGVELLIHVGIDTVSLKGDGFNPQVEEGQEITAGDPLLFFDLDKIASRARDCITPLVFVSGASQVSCDRRFGPIKAGEMLLRVIAEDSPSVPTKFAEATTAHVCTTVGLAHGIHARPAGRIAKFAKAKTSAIQIFLGDQAASASSTSELLRLGISKGDEVSIRVQGGDARRVAIELSELLDQLAMEEGQSQASSLPALQIDQADDPDIGPNESRGVRASPGIAIGPVHNLQTLDLDIPNESAGRELERARLHGALANVRNELAASANTAGKAVAEISEAHLELLDDESLISRVEKQIDAGMSAPAAWRQASRKQEEALLASASDRIRERAIDFRDVERRIIGQMLGVKSSPSIEDLIGSVVVCDDIEPSILMLEGSEGIAAICCANGGATSHASILAASVGVPMVVSLGKAALSLEDGTMVAVDANRAVLNRSPSSEQLLAYEKNAAAERAVGHAAVEASKANCFTKDGVRVEVFANLASLADAKAASERGAEGCGLLRTEFLFSERNIEPTEEEQASELEAIARALAGKPFIIRTLDVGGDKPISYFPFDNEANPALGLRGIRFGLKNKEVLNTQLRAMMKAVPSEQLRIMLPMVVEADEIKIVREMVEQISRELGRGEDVPLGIMVETPAAVMMSNQLAEIADFFSIGSNDLAQYVLAMDRGNSQLAARADALHPAVLRAIRATADGARGYDRWVGICGGLASEPDAAPLLVGLGCVELSAVPRAIPAIKQAIRGWSQSDCVSLAEEALKQPSAAAVRALLTGARS